MHAMAGARIESAGANSSDDHPWKDPKRVSDRTLKTLLCEAGSVKYCRGCRLCAYGKELLRRADEKDA